MLQAFAISSIRQLPHSVCESQRTGQTPFRGDHAQVMYQHQHAPLPLGQLEGLPQNAVALLQTLLEKDPARRFQNPAELLNAMQTVTNELEARPTVKKQKLLAPIVHKLSSRQKAKGREQHRC